jgi:O-antigen/teichoic acid export membrane protein
MNLLYKESVSESASIFSLLMMSFVAIATTYIFGTLLTANGNLKQLNQMALAGMVLNIVLNLILIPLLLAKGAAIASLVTQSITAFIQVVLCFKVFKIKPNYSIFFRYVIFTVLAVTVTQILFQLEINWMLTAMLSALIILIISLLIKLIDVKALREIIKTEN